MVRKQREPRKRNFRTPLEEAMETLSISTRLLEKESGIDHTLLSRWQQGKRILRPENKQLDTLVETMLRLDSAGRLHGLLSFYYVPGETAADTLRAFLTDTEGTERRAGAKRPALRQTTGSYEVTYRVYLGKQGFRKAALSMLDTARTLPPGQTITVLAQGRFDWFIGHLPFVVQLLAKLHPLLAQGTRLHMINRHGFTIAETSAFAGPWLLAHLKGYIRSLYYDGELPLRMRFAASIPGYFSGYAREDAEVEDGLYVSLHMDPLEIREVEAMMQTYKAQSRYASQYRFFPSPQGDAETPCLWKPGPMPGWKDGDAPDGSFYAITRVPGLGMMTRAEYDAVRGQDAPAFPSYLFAEGAPGKGPHRILLCREDVREGLRQTRRMHEALSAMLSRRAFVSREVLAAQLRRLLAAMAANDDFEVALVPHVAFTKLQMEMVCWKDGVSVCWLQDMAESVFADDQATSGSFHGWIGYVWDKLLAGWKRKSTVRQQLGRWLKGEGLDVREEDSEMVKRWEVGP